MFKKLPTFIALAAALAAGQASAAEFIRPICGEPQLSVALKATADNAAAAKKVFDALIADEVGACIQRGPIKGSWVIDGNKTAMLIGVVPVGKDRVPHLQVWFGGYQLIGPLTVEVIPNPLTAGN